MINIKKSSLVLLLFISTIGVQAQGTLYVKEKAGTKTSYDLSTVRKLTFSATNVNVNLKSGGTTSYGISAVQRFSFVDYDLPLSTAEISSNSSNVLLYPNPVSDFINLSIESSKVGSAQLEIVDIQSKVVFSQNLVTQIGKTSVSIPASQLNQGSYVCRIQQEGKLDFVKFIK